MYRTLRALSLAALLFAAATSAQAITSTQTQSLGDISNTSFITSQNWGSSSTGIDFTNTFDFSLSTSSFLSAVANGFGVGDFNLSANFPLVLNSSNAPSDPTTLSLASVLSPGNYSLVLSGIVGGAGGGYSLALNSIATGVPAVPEPGEWMLFASGLILVGFMARRRSRLDA